MTRRLCGTAVAFLLITLAPAAWSEQFYLYSPKAVGADDKVQAGDGVLVREVAVEKGDTLSRLSRKFSGHGSYYSQILLFNNIKNPNLIYTGDTLRVPVSNEKGGGEESKALPHKKKKAGAVHRAKGHKKTAPIVTPTKKSSSGKSAESLVELPLSELKRIDKGNHRQSQKSSAKAVQKPSARAEKAHPAATPGEELQRPVSESSADQQLFERAVRAYRQEDCKTALDLFERFIASNPSSPLAADASLYKAECYLKLSAQ
jgi:LysM repeat protein